MENYLSNMLVRDQGRAPNTINLRKMYNDYVLDMQTSGGETPLKFEEWAAKNYPQMEIIHPN